MTKYRIGEIIGICEVMDKNLDRIQKKLQEVIDDSQDVHVISQLNEVNSSLDGLGVDIDTMISRLKDLI